MFIVVNISVSYVRNRFNNPPKVRLEWPHTLHCHRTGHVNYCSVQNGFGVSSQLIYGDLAECVHQFSALN